MNFIAISAFILLQAFQPPTGPTPRTPSGKVDFSGVWAKPYVPDMTKDGANQKGMAVLPFTPWGEMEWKNYDEAVSSWSTAVEHNYEVNCSREILLPEPPDRSAPYHATMVMTCPRDSG